MIAQADFPVPHPEYKALRQAVLALQTEITSLVGERDELRFQTCRHIEAEYQIKIGSLECKAFEFQCEYFRLRRKIELVQQAINLQQTPNLDEIEKKLDDEQEEYMNRLAEMKRKMDDALLRSQTSQLLAVEDATRLRKLYFDIVRKIHPDLNPERTARDEMLLQAAMKAYEIGNLEQLDAVAAALMDIDSDSETETEWEQLTYERERFEKIRTRLVGEIEAIKNAFPYNMRAFLDDKSAVAKKKSELSDALKMYQEHFAECESRLRSMLKRGKP